MISRVSAGAGTMVCLAAPSRPTRTEQLIRRPPMFITGHATSFYPCVLAAFTGLYGVDWDRVTDQQAASVTGASSGTTRMPYVVLLDRLMATASRVIWPGSRAFAPVRRSRAYPPVTSLPGRTARLRPLADQHPGNWSEPARHGQNRLKSSGSTVPLPSRSAGAHPEPKATPEPDRQRWNKPKST
jgi:hypothetical protein